jgi:hypothetical protein
MRIKNQGVGARGRVRAAAVGGLLGVVTLAAACFPQPEGPEVTIPVDPEPVAVYDSVPEPLPFSLASVGFQARSTKEFGDHIQLAGTARNLMSAKVTMVTWAYASQPSNVAYCSADPSRCTETGWDHDLTLKVYAVDDSGAVPATGALLGTATEIVEIPWRDEPSAECGGTLWQASDGNCFNGYAFTHEFDLAAIGITAQDEVIVSVAYNTQSHGYSPLGEAGPYDSLNVGLVVDPAEGEPIPAARVGADVDADAAFQNTTFAGFYADGGAAGTGTFRHDTNWTSRGTPAIQLVAI